VEQTGRQAVLSNARLTILFKLKAQLKQVPAARGWEAWRDYCSEEQNRGMKCLAFEKSVL